ncbi:aminoglycoside phosphotransferase family protein [Salinicola aestuarinus]|uniref:aminoglycoside phosphotransferase family protein n=1 Tax=Salinicola aestuarinus TaxID=1949082 RepID=UPI000DA12A3C|nr:phosphotransferase [Salinicola aestuarinus]
MTLRLDALRDWIAHRHDLSGDSLRLDVVAGDASLRGYCRVGFPDGTTRIVMDAPPALEDSRPFVTIGRDWREAGLPVPAIHGADLDQGFLELDDLGDDSLHHHFVDAESARAGTERALDVLDAIQHRAPVAALATYTPAFLDEEMERFPDWGLGRWLGIDTPETWPGVKQHLLAQIAALPTVAVHRDFDAMNLMIHRDALWIIDFQGALAGPLGYDLISLLRGRYQHWPVATVANWIEAFRQQVAAAGDLPDRLDREAFHAAVEAIGVQRQLKILGQFCRLCLRDGKPRYLDWLPHFFAQLDDGLAALPALASFRTWLNEVYHPTMLARLAEHRAKEHRAKEHRANAPHASDGRATP